MSRFGKDTKELRYADEYIVKSVNGGNHHVPVVFADELDHGESDWQFRNYDNPSVQQQWRARGYTDTGGRREVDACCSAAHIDRWTTGDHQPLLFEIQLDMWRATGAERHRDD